MTKTRYVVAYRIKEKYRSLGSAERRYFTYAKEKDAAQHYSRLRGLTVYRVLSFGFGNVLKQQGRERDA